jgi:coenzyme F420-reducing hydrogenase gamma subunit
MSRLQRHEGNAMDGDGINGTIAGRGPGGRFAAGNPGRPPGTRHKTTQAILTLLDGEAVALTRKAVELALSGDVTAMRLCLERIAPVRRDGPVMFALPALTCAADAARAAAAILGAVAEGELTPTEGASIMALVETWRRTFELTQIETRLSALEGTA